MLVKRYVKDAAIFKIYQEDSPRNPRKEGDPWGTLVGNHPRLDLVDADLGEPASDGALKQFRQNFEEPLVYLPVYLLDRGGLRVSTESFNNPWDSGKLGIIYVTQRRVIVAGLNLEQAQERLRTEIEVLNYYVSGEVYGYTKYTQQTCSECGTVSKVLSTKDSCWGFLGSDHEKSGLLESADVILSEWAEEREGESHIPPQ